MRGERLKGEAMQQKPEQTTAQFLEKKKKHNCMARGARLIKGEGVGDRLRKWGGERKTKQRGVLHKTVSQTAAARWKGSLSSNNITKLTGGSLQLNLGKEEEKAEERGICLTRIN